MSKIKIENISLWFGKKEVLKDISLHIQPNSITALIGPSGSGKSTLLRCINRMHDQNDEVKISGHIFKDEKDIYAPEINVNEIRREIGMVFQKPNPFPKTIYNNIAYGLKINGIKDKKNIQQKVEESLKDSYLWDEVNDSLNKSALSLSGGQQQRLCIARCLAIEPEVILMDEPTSALDPLATKEIEKLILKLKKKYTIIIVTHNMQQAQRIADKIAMLYMGSLIEYSDTKEFFDNPQHKLAKQYVKGKFG